MRKAITHSWCIIEEKCCLLLNIRLLSNTLFGLHMANQHTFYVIVCAFLLLCINLWAAMQKKPSHPYCKATQRVCSLSLSHSLFFTLSFSLSLCVSLFCMLSHACSFFSKLVCSQSQLSINSSHAHTPFMCGVHLAQSSKHSFILR